MRRDIVSTAIPTPVSTLQDPGEDCARVFVTIDVRVF